MAMKSWRYLLLYCQELIDIDLDFKDFNAKGNGQRGPVRVNNGPVQLRTKQQNTDYPTPPIILPILIPRTACSSNSMLFVVPPRLSFR